MDGIYTRVRYGMFFRMEYKRERDRELFEHTSERAVLLLSELAEERISLFIS